MRGARKGGWCRLRTASNRALLQVACCVLACLLASWPDTSLAQTAALPATTQKATAPQPESKPAEQSATAEPKPPPTRKVANPPAKATEFQRQLQRLTRHIRQLRTKELDPNIDPRTLFDVDLDDENALQIEASRLRLLLSDSAPDAGLAPYVERAQQWQRGLPPDAGKQQRKVQANSWTRGELTARLQLDRERLAFYSLPESERRALRDAQQQRQLEGKASQVDQQADEAEERAKEAQRQRQEALEAAQNARTEALRLLAEEQANLLGIAAAQAQFEARLLERRSELNGRQEVTLSWQRKVREMLSRAQRHEASAAEVSELYTSLRDDLRAARNELGDALSGALGVPDVPGPGPDRTDNLPEDVDATALRAKWNEVSAEAERLARLENQFLSNRAQILYEHVKSLNEDRLALFPYLSDGERHGIVGFGARGLDQARAELRQVVLTARHRFFEATRWLGAVEVAGGARTESAVAVLLVALKWMAAIGAFIWWRRRSAIVLRTWREFARKERRLDRSVTRSPLERFLTFLQQVHKPLESLVLSIAVISLLPEETQQRLEVQLLAIVLYWIFGGAFVVTAIDALSGQTSGRHLRDSQMLTAQIRLRSLRLLGRVVVIVALVLSLTREMVGKGTIYDWVLSTCWFAAIPVVLVITKWWRDIIFERLERRRKKPPLAQWALRQTGWRSLLVAIGAGGFLLYEGVIRTVKPLVTGFDLTKRVLAYLFRRDLSKRAEDTEASYEPIPKKLYSNLGPSTPSEEIVPSIADAQVSEVIERVNQAGGGVFALVGERGSGKSTVLRRIAAESRDAHLVKCPLEVSELTSCVARALGADEGSSFEEAAALVNTSDRNAGILFDDAHRLIKPMMGGLVEFDKVIDLASRHSQHCAWVFAFDEVMWSFLERARGTKPMFDDVIALSPWGEDGIAALLKSRSQQTHVNPDFSALVGTLPPDADEIDRQEALTRTSTGYHRLIWDYASGNPGIALHTWRRSLAQNPDGNVVVCIFRVPDVRELEALPDPPVFVLRAVVQLEYASVADLTEATRLSRATVDTALRFACMRGYVEQRGDRYWITWAWFRPITRFLERRHLLSKK